MGDVVNLRQFRKQKERAEKEDLAQENREKHGRRKSDVQLMQSRKDLDDKRHDGHQIDPEDDGPQIA